MTSSTYGTAELQGEPSPSPPKSYLSRVAKIALALIACGAVIAHPVTRMAAINLVLDPYGRISNVFDDDGNRSGGNLKDKVRQLNARVTAIEK